MTKVENAICWTFGLISLVIILIVVQMPYGHSPIPVTCERLYYREVTMIRKAIDEYSRTGKPFPTLEELIAEGLYTLPQNRELREDNYPINPNDLRVKLFHIDHPHIVGTCKIIVTSTTGKCAKGNTLVVSSSQFLPAEWLERQLTH